MFNLKMLSYALAVRRPVSALVCQRTLALSPLSAAKQAAEPAELLQRDSRAAATAVIAGSYNDAACQAQRRVAKHRLQEARDAQNLHEITDLLTRLRAIDARAPEANTNQLSSFARIAAVAKTARRLLLVAASALAAKGRIETCSG